jgi:hypothetical protein
MSSLAMEVFGNLAFLLTTCAFMLRDIIKLRTISIISSVIWLIYLFTKSEILWISVFWNCVFIAVNLTHIIMFLRETRGVELSENDKELRRRMFPSMPASDFKRLMGVAHRANYEAGTRLTEAGKNTEDVTLIVHGSVRVDLDGGLSSRYGAGHFVGEVSFLESSVIASATVTALEPLHCLVWRQDKLRELLDGNPSMRNEFNAIMTGELARKLARTL